jgi:RNA polymerase sigma-70 factor (ECF subfamily)
MPPEIADGAIWSVMMVPTSSQPAASAGDTVHPQFSENRPTPSPAGLAELHRVHSGRLMRFFARHGARQDAADLVQESFARLAGAWAKRPRIAIERPEAYLSRIALNLLRERARVAARRSMASHISADEVPLAGNDPIAALEARDQLERLQASLARLSPKSRSVFLAHRRDGVSYKEIANREGLSEKAVQRRMSKAIAHINRARRAC